MVTKSEFPDDGPFDPWKKKKDLGGPPQDRSKKREPFKFSSDKQHPDVGKNFPDPSKRSGKFADWSEEELRNYLKFLDNPPKPEDLEERPEGGYNP